MGSPSARSMARWASRRVSAISPAKYFAVIAAKDSPSIKVGSPMDSSSPVYSEASRDASRGRSCSACVISNPAMPMASDTLSPAAAARSRSSSKPVSATLALTRHAVPHSRVRGAIRIEVRSGSSGGSRSAIWRARCQLTRAAVMSRVLDQVAARMCQS